MADKAKDPLEYGKYSKGAKEAKVPKAPMSLEDRAMERYQAITKRRQDIWKKFHEGGMGNLPLKDIQYPPNADYDKDPVIKQWMKEKWGDKYQGVRIGGESRGTAIRAARELPVQEAPYVKQVLGSSKRATKALTGYEALDPRYRSAVGKAVHEAKAAGKPLRAQAAEALRLVRKLGKKVPKVP